MDVRAEEISRLVQETASAQGQVADLRMQLDTAEHRLATALERATQAEEEVRLLCRLVYCSYSSFFWMDLRVQVDNAEHLRATVLKERQGSDLIICFFCFLLLRGGAVTPLRSRFLLLDPASNALPPALSRLLVLPS